MTTQTTLNNEKLSPWPWQVEESATEFNLDAMAKVLKDLSEAATSSITQKKGWGSAKRQN